MGSQFRQYNQRIEGLDVDGTQKIGADCKFDMSNIKSQNWRLSYLVHPIFTDYPHTFTQAWKDHRQALRDVPQNNPSPDLDDNGDLINVVWPETPEYPGNSGPM